MALNMWRQDPEHESLAKRVHTTARVGLGDESRDGNE